MARGSGGDARTASTVYRLPTEGDHPVLATIGFSLALGLAVFAFAVLPEGRRRRWRPELPVHVGLALGVGAAVVCAVVYGVWVRGAPRGQALRVGPEGLAFAQGRTERWAIPWEVVISAGVAHSALPRHRGEPAPSFLRLELEEGTAPADPSLHHHEGAWWFPLSGFDTAARLHHELARRIPDRTRAADAEVRLPRSMATRGGRR